MSDFIPEYNTVLFNDIYETKDEFLSDYQNIGLSTTITTANATNLFYLLSARYGATPIINKSVDQFKLKLFATIYQYGLIWEKKMSIQTTLRGLTEAELLQGAKQIYNDAFNPETTPKTGDLEEIGFINAQKTANVKKSKFDAYSSLIEVLNDGGTEEFLMKFNKLFKKFVKPERKTLFVTELGE